jgi:hypothetical protein
LAVCNLYCKKKRNKKPGEKKRRKNDTHFVITILTKLFRRFIDAYMIFLHRNMKIHSLDEEEEKNHVIDT